MEPATDRFRPTAPDTREAMESLQLDIASAATFENEAAFTPADVRTGDAVVAGIDQAFLDDRAVSAIVAIRGGDVIAREHAVTPLSMPYIPGLLAFREGESIVAALESLEIKPDLLVFDGSGRIHYREAGIATHVGVCFDIPSIGVAKSLLCGRPRRPTDALQAGERVPIEADDSMTAPDGTVVGHAYQSRQYPDSTTINPLYVSPGNRLNAATATDCIAACGGEYKLPRPTRLADQYADELKTDSL